ncbi:palmitoyltransferase ZDHHC16 isoform X2 [Zophobas morio]|uniref:palmitoyltransferase ZDHHC16 isoform X2 n=1 Tax=Zophobas morio TaxID=2755281 RepID=UPI0030833FFC
MSHNIPFLNLQPFYGSKLCSRCMYGTHVLVCRQFHLCNRTIIIGHWLLLNISFHYYMAVITPPGYPPQGELITEAVSICKKCIAPKPPRTHHCSVCNRCILKMDHHCPWLNNCVGYKNHRYFFMYMVYMVLGVLFVIICGVDIAYSAIMLTGDDPDEPELEGHPVKFNKTGALIPVTDVLYIDTPVVVDEFSENYEPNNPWRRRAIIYMALINSGVFVALGVLAIWHSRLIGKGETSIEGNINKAETQRLAEIGRIYINPYNFGTKKNWRIFLGLVQGRTFLQHVLLPSAHEPVGDGLTWHTVHDEDVDEWP